MEEMARYGNEELRCDMADGELREGEGGERDEESDEGAVGMICLTSQPPPCRWWGRGWK